MNRFYPVLVVLSFAMCFAIFSKTLVSVAAPPDDTKVQSPLTQQLISLEKAFSEAQMHHDRETYKKSLTDDFISIGTDGKIHSREELLGDLSSTQLAEYRLYNVQVVPLNEGAAVVTYDAIVRMVHYDDETPRYQHISSVWVKQGEDWKLKFQQATPGT
jgi:hypothetical protein